MRIALVHNALFPVQNYGGTERVVWWLAKGLFEAGHQVILHAAPGSQCEFAHSIKPFSHPPVEVDLVHHFAPHAGTDTLPAVFTIGGNGKAGERFPRNTVFVSRNHAARHQAEAFVYNGLDPAEYHFEKRKSSHLVFCAKASWRVKNVAGAIRISRAAGCPLDVIGGKSIWPWRWRGVRFRGLLGGAEKSRLLSSARALVFPVIWHEPFGIAVTEALVSGTPVYASPYGSLPELLPADVGKICSSEAEFVQALRSSEVYSAERCREWCLEHFHYRKMTESYLQIYERVGRGEFLNSIEPFAATDQGKFVALPRRPE